MATFRKYNTKKGQRWRYQILLGTDPATGKRRYKTKGGFKTKRDAKLSADEVEKALYNDDFYDDQGLTFGEVYTQWFDSRKSELKESSAYIISSNFKWYILPHLEHVRLKKITPLICQRIVDEWFQHPLKLYKRYAIYVSSVLNYAKRLNLIDSNPMDKVVIPKDKNQPYLYSHIDNSKNFYSLDELKKFLDYAKGVHNPNVYYFFRLLGFSGLRKGEALALNWSDIDFDKGTLSINKTLTRIGNGVKVTTPKTAASKRTVYLDNLTMKDLSEWRIIQTRYFGLTPKVFCTPQRTYISVNQPNRWANSISKKVGIKKITPHGFRHTYATLAVAGGMDVKQLQAQLGHSDVKLTLGIYASVTEKQRQETPAVFSKYVNF